MTRQKHQGTQSDVHTKHGPIDETEIAFTRLLDQAQITYEYEPHRLHVGYLEHDGKMKDRAMQPDFWLPGLDMYVELTTSFVGSMNMDLKLAKVNRLKDGQGDKRICIMSGAALRWLLSHEPMTRDELIQALEKGYELTCTQAGIRTRAESIAARAEREATINSSDTDRTW